MEGVRGALSQGSGQIVFMIIIAILLVWALYYVYNWLNRSSTDQQDYIQYSSINKGLDAKTVTTYGIANVPIIYSGGEFSVSTWIYVKNWTSNQNKVFLTLSSNGTTPVSDNAYNTLVMYLGYSTNKLGVRVSCAGNTNLGSTEMAKISAYTAGYTDSDNLQGDISIIPLQRWVNITVAVSGKTLDVYIDGKLSRSTQLPGMFNVSGADPYLTLGSTDKGFTGMIGQTRAANFAYAPDQVYRNYLSGPFSTTLLDTLYSYINPTKYTIQITST